METVTSRIKTMFTPELLRYIAAICDTKRIDSNNEKMIVLGNLLYSNGVNFEILGGATNRIALQIDGYAVKFAMDEQGYLDNLIEYSLSPELQPYVTKSYETNGYIQVQELVEVMTKELFKVHRTGIYKILDTMCQDYLLGDVGYLEKNRTNWGIRNGSPVILDYAYCHRATENLFTCSRCGAALTYDSTYDKLMCTDRSGCKSIFTYNERKRVQGKKVDEDMIKERKSQSIRLAGEDISKDIEMFEDRLVGDNYFIIDNPGDAFNYEKLKEAIKMQISINGGDENMTDLETRFAAMVDLAKNPNDASAKQIMEADCSGEVPEAIYTDNYQEKYMFGNTTGIRMYNLGNEDDSYDEEEDEFDPNRDDVEDTEAGLSDLIDMINQSKKAVDDDFNSRSNAQVQEYLNSRKEKDTKEEKEPETADEAVKTAISNLEVDGGDIVITAGDTEEDYEALRKEEEDELKKLHEEDSVVVEEPEEEDSTEDVDPEDAAILVNGKPLPIGKEVTV